MLAEWKPHLFSLFRSKMDQIITLQNPRYVIQGVQLVDPPPVYWFQSDYESVKLNELCQVSVEHGFPTELNRPIRARLHGSILSGRIFNRQLLGAKKQYYQYNWTYRHGAVVETAFAALKKSTMRIGLTINSTMTRSTWLWVKKEACLVKWVFKK